MQARGTRDEPADLQVLETMMSDKELAARLVAVVDAGGTSEAALRALVTDPEQPHALRGDLCWLIPRLALDDAAGLIEPLLADPDATLRAEAAMALGVLGSPSAVGD